MKPNEQFNNEMLLQLSLMVKRLKATSGGRGIQSITIDNLTGNLLVTYDDASQVDLGHVVGPAGDDGVSILDVQLYEDPLNPKDVFIQTTLSSGVILRSRDSLAGYHGLSLKDAYIHQNNIHFVLDDLEGTELPPIPVDGLDAISVTNVAIVAGDLVFTLSDNREINVGAASSLQGRGVQGVKMETGKLLIQYDNAPEWVDVGPLDGVASVAMVGGKLVYRKSSAPEADVELGTVVSITGAKVTGNELIFTTNQTGELAEINVGAVANLKGDVGVGIDTVNIVDNTMVVTLTDTTVINIPVTGLTPISVTGARYDDITGDIVFLLSDGSEITSGIKEDMRGEGVENVTLTATGDLNFFYTKDPLTPVKVGVVQSIVATRVEAGKVIVNYNTNPDLDVEVGSLLGIASMIAENGKFHVTYTNGSKVEIGSARAIDSMAIDEQFNLVVTYTDGLVVPIGNLPKGDVGVGYVGATVDPTTGDLLLSRSDGVTDNAGQVRLDIDNMIGSINTFVAMANQTEYVVEHSGSAMCWVDGVLLDDASMDFSLSERVVFTAPFLGGEKVHVISFAPTGSVITGFGVKSITEKTVGVFTMVLENGTEHVINTVTTIPQEDLPPGITGVEVSAGGELLVTLSDGVILNAGSVANAINIVNAEVDIMGDLQITLSDDTVLNAGSVMSNLAISNVEVDVDGNLIITMNSGGVFNAGPTGVYITGANIDAVTGKLMIRLSDQRVLDAGNVVNPLTGTEYEFTCFEGQTEFVVAHGEYIPLVWANAALLSKASMDLTDPLRIVLRTPRVANDIVRVVLMSKGEIRAVGLESEAAAEENTFYGKRDGVMGWYPGVVNKIAAPIERVATPAQTVFNNIENTGDVEIHVNGSLRHTGYTVTNGRVVFDEPMVGGENVRLTPLTAPTPMGTFLPTAHAKVSNKVFANGGSFVQGKWVTRQLNSVDYNAIGLGLQNNRIILPVGTYYLKGWAAAGVVHANALKLFNTTSGKSVLDGDSCYSDTQSRATIQGYFTLNAQSALVLQHRCVTSMATYGLGRAGSGGDVSRQADLGIPACLASLEFWKVG